MMLIQKIYEHSWITLYKLTPRETDVLACLLENPATKKIAPILNVGIKGVDTHILNIMNKLEQCSRANVIDFVKKTDCRTDLRKHYFNLFTNFEFRETLKKIRQHLKNREMICKITCKDETLKEQITTDLESLNINCFERKKEATVILIEPQDNYYQTFFDVLHQLLSDPFIEEAIQQFKRHISHQIPEDCYETKKEVFITLKHSEKKSFIKKLYIAMALLIVCVLTFFYFKYNQNTHVQHIRSDLNILDHTKVLQRSKILEKINEAFKSNDPIKIVILSGIGGAGKTTIARQYEELEKNIFVLWEVNAETRETLVSSFTKLAEKLTKTKNDKSEVIRIKQIDDQEEHIRMLIQFVKQKLICYKNWFLIFDNVENFQTIRQFFPTDSKSWGCGKVLITTRNSNLNSVCHLRGAQMVMVGELADQEKKELFLQILPNIKTIQETLKSFLRLIPPFPLDVTLAAYYIKDTNCSLESYKKYLLNMDEKNSSIRNAPQFLDS